MYAEIDKIDNSVNIYTEEGDRCGLCANTEICPLMAAISDEVVVLRYEAVEVGSCPLYEEFRFEAEDLFTC